MNNAYTTCLYNKHVDCDDFRNCFKCAWNPKNHDLRKEREHRALRKRAETRQKRLQEVEKQRVTANAREVYCVELDMVFSSASAAARYFDVAPQAIRQCLAGRMKTCKGYHFVLAEDVKKNIKREGE